MKIFLCGVSCVGKSSIGTQLAQGLGYRFYDFDLEVERFYGKSIACLKSKFLTEYSFRKEASIVLKKIIDENRTNDFVVVLPPSGLHAPYHRLIRTTKGIVIVLSDTPENILDRITFYDDDSNRIPKQLTEREKKLYLKEIRKDITYYKSFYKKADRHVDIAGLGISGSVEKIEELLRRKGGLDC